MGKVRNLIKKIKHNDRGEALVLVIVVMGAIMIMGIALLFATYTAYSIRVTQKASEKTFSSADTGMEMIKDGLTDVESKAAEAAYAKVLKSYEDSSYDQVVFRQEFTKALAQISISGNGDVESDFDKTTGSGSGSGIYLFPGSSSTNVTQYKPEAINNFLKHNTSASGDKYEFSGSGKVETDVDGSVVLKDLDLVYTKSNGYVTRVHTDIRLKVPDITATAPTRGFSLNPLVEFSCIADQGLYIKNKGGKFDGSIYAGNVTIEANESSGITVGNRLIIGKSRKTGEILKTKSTTSADGVVTTEPIKDRNNNDEYEITFDDDEADRSDGKLVFGRASGTGGGSLSMMKDTTLWAHDIELNNKASLTEESDAHIYVGNDMVFGQYGGTATLNGTYIGFGSRGNASDSSSIIFNNKNVTNTTNNQYTRGSVSIPNGSVADARGTLNISNIQNLRLAGHTFIMESTSGSTGNEIGMGSSITTRPEQMIYLVPADNSDGEDILAGYTNPNTIEISAGEDAKTKTTEIAAEVKKSVLANKDKSIAGMSHSLAYYGISSDSNITVRTYTMDSGNRLQYYFFKFDSVAQANQFFKDYYKANKDTIINYINDYASIDSIDPSRLVSEGTGLSKTGDDIDVTSGSDGLATMSNNYTKKYKNLSETLTEKSSGSETPFFHYIDADELHTYVMANGGKNKLIPIAWWIDHNNWEGVSDPIVYNVDPMPSVNASNHQYNGNDILLIIGRTYKYNNKELTITGPDMTTNNGIKVRYADGTTGTITAKAVAGVCAWTEKHNSDNADNWDHITVRGDSVEGSNFAIVDGNVDIDGTNFYGLLMCSGKAEMGGTNFITRTMGISVLEKTDIWKGNKNKNKKSTGEDWTLNKMVVYENWNKN